MEFFLFPPPKTMFEFFFLILSWSVVFNNRIFFFCTFSTQHSLFSHGLLVFLFYFCLFFICSFFFSLFVFFSFSPVSMIEGHGTKMFLPSLFPPSLQKILMQCFIFYFGICCKYIPNITHM